MKILLHHFFPKLKYSLVYKHTGPIPGYKPMGLQLVWACLRGNRVLDLLTAQNINLQNLFCCNSF